MAPSAKRSKKAKIIDISTISKFVPPEQKIQLSTKQVTYDFDHLSIPTYPKGKPQERINRIKNVRLSDGEFEIGDLVWSQVEGSPFWPAMVASDPRYAHYHRKSIKNPSQIDSLEKYKVKEEFFVEYFGLDASLGWNASDKIIPFLGYDQLLSQVCMHDTAHCECSKKVPVSKFKVWQNARYSWNYAIAEAHEAMKMSKEQRIELLSFEYKWQSEGLKEGRAYGYPHWFRIENEDKGEDPLVERQVPECPTLKYKKHTKRRPKPKIREAHLLINMSPQQMKMRKINSEVLQFIQPQFDPTEVRGTEYFDRELLTEQEKDFKVESGDDSKANSDACSDIDPNVYENVTNVHSPAKSDKENVNLHANSMGDLKNRKRPFELSAQCEVRYI